MRHPTITSKVNIAAACCVLLSIATFVASHCANSCSGHGECQTGSLTTCTCYHGWTGGDCSMRMCPNGTAWTDDAVGVDDAHRPAECSNRGVCDYSTGKCMCQEGFEGLACQRMSCMNECSYHGRCVSMEYHAKHVQHTNQLASYTKVWDYNKIYGCECDEGYEGHDCSLRQCPRGDDPMTSNQMTEIQLLYCYANSGFFTLTLDGQTSVNIPHDADLADLGHALEKVAGAVRVFYVNPGLDSTVCDVVDGSMISIEFVDRYGSVPALEISTDWQSFLHAPANSEVLLVYKSTGSVNTMTPWTMGPTTGYARPGNKEWEYCSGRGRCNQVNGLCECYSGFYSSDGYGQSGVKGDCGAALDPISSCPGTPLECSGHGLCSDFPEYKCTCMNGWTGGDCSERICPFGRAWFDAPTNNIDDVAHAEAECSNKGICDRRSGVCRCERGFEGDACERISCPQYDEVDVCSSHGRCMSMMDLALNADNNGDAADYTYGTNANSNATWDFKSMWGCKCDEGWHGYDCALKSCPTGDDPHTPGVPEIQVLRCQASSGYFTLSFRQFVTDHIQWDDDLDTLKYKLESLHTIQGVDIVFQPGTTQVCEPMALSTIVITFTQNFGDLPALRVVDTSNLAGIGGFPETVNIIADGTGGSQKGTMDDAVCSNRGICDERRGLCECFLQWGSSNGANGFGSRGDCGHVTPFAEVPPTSHLRSRDASRNPFTPDSTEWERANYGNVKDATLWKRAKFGADRDHAARWREKVMIDNWPKRDSGPKSRTTFDWQRRNTEELLSGELLSEKVLRQIQDAERERALERARLSNGGLRPYRQSTHRDRYWGDRDLQSPIRPRDFDPSLSDF